MNRVAQRVERRLHEERSEPPKSKPATKPRRLKTWRSLFFRILLLLLIVPFLLFELGRMLIDCYLLADSWSILGARIIDVNQIMREIDDAVSRFLASLSIIIRIDVTFLAAWWRAIYQFLQSWTNWAYALIQLTQVTCLGAMMPIYLAGHIILVSACACLR